MAARPTRSRPEPGGSEPHMRPPFICDLTPGTRASARPSTARRCGERPGAPALLLPALEVAHLSRAPVPGPRAGRGSGLSRPLGGSAWGCSHIAHATFASVRYGLSREVPYDEDEPWETCPGPTSEA